jgi:hypothetical protein
VETSFSFVHGKIACQRSRTEIDTSPLGSRLPAQTLHLSKRTGLVFYYVSHAWSPFERALVCGVRVKHRETPSGLGLT